LNGKNRFLLGVKVFDKVPLQEIAEFIDWQPFSSLEMHGKFPQLLSDEVIGEAAPVYLKMQKPC